MLHDSVRWLPEGLCPKSSDATDFDSAAKNYRPDAVDNLIADFGNREWLRRETGEDHAEDQGSHSKLEIYFARRCQREFAYSVGTRSSASRLAKPDFRRSRIAARIKWCHPASPRAPLVWILLVEEADQVFAGVTVDQRPFGRQEDVPLALGRLDSLPAVRYRVTFY